MNERLPDRNHGKSNGRTYMGKLPKEAQKKLVIEFIILFLMLIIGIPILCSAGAIQYQWQLYLAFIFIAVCFIVICKDAEKARKEAQERENFEMIANAVRSGRYCIYCGAIIPAGAKFCPECGKQI